MEQLQVIETPSRDLIQRIAVFAQEEADWHTTPLDISLVNGFFILMFGSDDTLVATGSVSFVSTAWLGNVVVAKKHRRKGFASEIVRALQREVQSRRPTMDFSLIASSLGQFVYPKLGYLSVGKVTMCELESSPPPEPSSLCAVVPTAEQHEAAIKLYQQSAGYSRRVELLAIFGEAQQCAVVIADGKVVAAAWARFTSVDGSEGKAGLFLGPVVAKFPDYAISVCSALLRLKGRGELPNSNRGVSALVLQKRGDDAELNVFKSLGFVARYQLQYMFKSTCSNTTRRGQSRTHEFSYPTPQYFSLVGFDLG